jgi:glutamate-1-semialdehyde 2,1-aminomutase
MNVVAIIQARTGSIRLPNKVMRNIGDHSMIELLIKRLNQSKEINKIVVATSKDPINNLLVSHIIELGFDCEQGSEDDVLDRYLQVAKKYQADIVVRITGDCPLIDSILVDEIIKKFKSQDVDYMSNTLIPTYPDGLDTEVFTYASLERAHKESQTLFDREHVTPYIKQSNLFKTKQFQNKEDYSYLRWTVDNIEDFQTISKVFKHFSPNINFNWREVLSLYKSKPEIFKNLKIKRNEGASMGKGQKLWQRAKHSILGGNMLLSKRPEMFLPGQWPTYFSKAKGCKVWDLDGKEYIDMSMMGIGTNLLGYGHPEVDEAVIKTVQLGNMSTLNCPEEVYLAEKLIEMHPWFGSVRFARSGGEANAIAIRIARAASGKDNVAICGYHGWHDWYLSANLSDNKNLDGHLLSGLQTKGVPRNLKGTVFPFNYNKINEIENLIKEKNIGTIVMEVMRNIEPEDYFLKKVRKLAIDNKIVLIFDECTSGFRETFGGLHKKYNVEPDIAMFGKALGNGYAITAILGRKEVMEAAQTSFISSTFWTERIGPSAALKTLEVMEREKSWNKVTNIGIKIRDRLQKLSNKYQLKISFTGLPALTSIIFQSDNALAYKTLISQEMLKKGYLAGNSIYVCTEHSVEVINGYFDAIEPIFDLISQCENGRDVEKLLEGQICHSGFKRLN